MRARAVAVIGTVLVISGVAAGTANAGVWLQQYGRTGECAEGFGSSWAEWAIPVTGGAVCTREIDDPSVPVSSSSSAPAPAPGPAPGPAWVVLHRPTLQPGELVGGSIVGWCPGGSDPQGLRSVPNTDIATLYYSQTMEGYIENLGSQARTFDLEGLCE